MIRLLEQTTKAEIMNKLTFLFSICILALFSCSEDCETTYTYETYIPVYKTPEELSPEITFDASRTMENPGKIYYYGDYILINEKNSGVHVIDNSDTQSPNKIGFISIEGNLDIALKGNYLYADDYYSLLVIDISDLQNPEITCTIPNIKEEAYFDDVRQSFIVDYEYITKQVDIGCDEEVPFEIEVDGNVLFNTDFRSVVDFGPQVLADAAVPGSVGGGGGSLARVAFIKNNFYYVNSHSMKVFDATELSKPDLLNTVYLDWGVETIFPYEDKIFIGANDGMHILDNSDPTNPQYISTFRHARACDPVVVQNDIAYVTLRDGSECQNFINQLDVVDVSDIKDPQLVASFPMDNPHGLSVRDNTLYLCEGEGGLKVFDVTNIEEIDRNLLSHIDQVSAYDVISISSDLLLMIGPDGFYQFDSSNPKSLKLLSAIRKGE